MMPQTLSREDYIASGQPDIARGEQVFWMGGCASCHAAPGSQGSDRLVLSGGLAIESDFGTFHAPNISPDPDHGIGQWSELDFANALLEGVGRHGENLYPSLPYTSYTNMSDEDVHALFAFLKTLPASAQPSLPNDLSFPFNLRPALSFWKILFFSEGPRVALEAPGDPVLRGQYIVEGAGHCGECHTPRNALGGLDESRWLAGGPNPDGPGTIPDITPGSKTIGSWSESEIADYLETGFTPDFDVAGGAMAEVQQNLSHLPRADLEAIAAYLKAIPAH
ncbi:c-type cytochrome [Martelella alba]|uniref:C-type cytochrome n=2 Tax=Martelella alba TaxID=2590451 RepID=A0A506UFJ6_9HYPH|nr:c-type cytochrome [Martelella alba]